MSRSIFLIFFILFFQVPVYASMVVSSKIDKVTVFTDSALVYRKADVITNKGENIFKLEGLPDSIVDDSISVAIIKGSGKITDLSVEKSYLTGNKQLRANALQERIEELDEKIRKLNGEMSAINSYIDFLRKLTPFTSNVKLLQSEFEGYAKFIETGFKNSYIGIADIETKLNKLKEEKSNLEKELTNIGKKQERVKNIIITLYGQKEEEVQLEIGYLVNNAMWTPQYDIHVDTSNSTISFDVYASITQNTKEDWQDVGLIISTSKPVVGKLKELTPWYVDIYRPREPFVYKSMEISKSIVADMKKEMLEDAESEPKIKEETTSFEFILKDVITVLSDNQPHRIFLTSKILGDKEKNSNLLEYVTIPKQSSFVFITGNLKNPLNFPIFPGKMNIYIDKRFIRSEQLSKIFVAGEDMQIPLGIDESIKVERKPIKKFTEYTGVISKTEKLIYEFEITVTNGKSRAVDITVKDNYPISQNEQIKTFLEHPSEKEAEISKDGIITWKLNIAPKETRKITQKFSIEYPKGLRITGIE
ncbi:MAG: mucoidy inhibitor MuiA family protein [Candidatus Omnitrophica bacterium]|nr:mucoidy inhibitor MuiA family protein [Candidatus Omnitrophota bacterium]